MTTDNNQAPPPYLWAAICFAVIMAIYLVTLAPTTAFWDTSEYIAAAQVLGIPHPPGNPLFTLMAHVWGLLPLAEEYARRINLFAAVTSAAGAGFWFLVAERWCRSILPARGPRLAAAFAGVLAGAMAWTVWNQSTVNEKVYTISLLSIAMTAWFAVRWADEAPGPRRDRWLLAIFYITALSSTNHMMGVLSLPLVAVYVLTIEPKIIFRPAMMLTAWLFLLAIGGVLGGIGASMVQGTSMSGAGMLGIAGTIGFLAWGLSTADRSNRLLWLGPLTVIAGISINYIYLPIRAAQLPPINEGEPAGFFSPALMDVLNRVQYAKPDEFSQRMSPFSAQLANYWHYWSWQWGRDLGGLAKAATALFTVLSLGGLWALFRKNWQIGLAAAALMGTITLMLIFYLNFKYGYSYDLGNTLITLEDREVRERDYFYVASFAFAGVLCAAAFAAMIKGIGDWLGERVPDARRYLIGTPVLALALVPLLGNRITASRANETIARDFAVDILESVEPYGILITAGDNDTFPLWFAQEILGVRRDVTLANLSLMNTDWHLRQLRRREIPDFNPATAAAIWRPNSDADSVPIDLTPDSGWVRPVDPVLSFTIPQLDSLPEAVATPPSDLVFDSLVIRFGQSYLTRSDLATVFLIRDNLGKRPIYFSWSNGTYPDRILGLEPYLVSHGLVRKLMPHPVQAGGNVVMSPQFGPVDIERTDALLFGVYHPEAAARERPYGWVDEPSSSILQLYYITYAMYAEVMNSQGNLERAQLADNIAQRVLRNLRP